LILLNGAHGHTLSGVMQPLFRVPVVGDSWHYFTLYARTNPSLCSLVRSCTRGFNLQLLYFVCIKPYFILTGHTYDWACVQYVLY
jgi:hypothetical protein